MDVTKQDVTNNNWKNKIVSEDHFLKEENNTIRGSTF